MSRAAFTIAPLDVRGLCISPRTSGPEASTEVMIRSAGQLARVVTGNPFASEPGNRVVAIFFDTPPLADAVDSAKNLADERLALGSREIYVHYPSGLGRSKLRLGGKARGTARNMNTVARLAELAREKA